MSADSGRAAIVCSHVGRGTAPILLASRSEPTDSSDSGWQFLCNSQEENWEDAMVLAMAEVIRLDPSISSFADSAPGSSYVRSDPDSMWRLLK